MNINEVKDMKDVIDFILSKVNPNAKNPTIALKDLLELKSTSMISKWRNNQKKINYDKLKIIKEKLNLTQNEYAKIDQINNQEWESYISTKKNKKNLKDYIKTNPLKEAFNFDESGFSISNFINASQIKNFNKVYKNNPYLVPIYSSSSLKHNYPYYIYWNLPVSYVLHILYGDIESINFSSGDLVGIMDYQIYQPANCNSKIPFRPLYLIKVKINNSQYIKIAHVFGLINKPNEMNIEGYINNLNDPRIIYYLIRESMNSSLLHIKKSDLEIIGWVINRLTQRFL